MISTGLRGETSCIVCLFVSHFKCICLHLTQFLPPVVVWITAKTPVVRPPVSFVFLTVTTPLFYTSAKRLRGSMTALTTEGRLGNTRVRWHWQTRLLLRSVRGNNNHRRSGDSGYGGVSQTTFLELCFPLLELHGEALLQLKSPETSIQVSGSHEIPNWSGKTLFTLFVTWKSSR